MSEQPATDEPFLTHRNPTKPLTPAHKALITILTEHLVEQYLAGKGGK